ncbi:uncharacterized protein [Ptychodera flava]|uniref:uncharacterized protein isoform X2 n=1 Tax=Ptychodera flava TaxID=63121 RepID=UPI00396AA8B6
MVSFTLLLKTVYRTNMNLKLVALSVIFLAISVQHAHAQTCKGSWAEAQHKAFCQGGGIGIVKRIRESFKTRNNEEVDDNRFPSSEVKLDESEEMPVSKTDYLELLRRVLEEYKIASLRSQGY